MNSNLFFYVVLSTPVGRIRKGKRAGVVALRVWVFLSVERTVGIDDGEADGVTRASGMNSRVKAIVCVLMERERYKCWDDNASLITASDGL